MTTEEISLDPDLLKFVTPPPDYLQLKCPICLELLLEDPYLVSCCGHHLCGICIKNLLHQPCPLCKSVSLQKVPDKGFQRALSSLSVFCLHKEQGCVWRGELKQLKQHLSREGDCNHIKLKCKHDRCGEILSRPLLKGHELSCGKRPATCGHCSTYQSTWDDVQSKHSKVCPDVLVMCPNSCGSSIKRRNLDNHITKTCTLRKIKCEFSFAGCEWSDIAENMPKHLDTCWRQHISYVTLYNSMEMKRQNEKIMELSKQVEGLKSFVNEVVADLTDQRMTRALKEVIHLPVVPEGKKTLQFIVNRFSFKRSNNLLHHSPEFIMNSRKMRVTVYCNGYKSGKGSHVSVYASFLTGFVPFNGHLVIRLHNQRSGDYLVELIPFDESTPMQVGIPKFIAFEDVGPYLRALDDGLQFELPQVII